MNGRPPVDPSMVHAESPIERIEADELGDDFVSEESLGVEAASALDDAVEEFPSESPSVADFPSESPPIGVTPDPELLKDLVTAAAASEPAIAARFGWHRLAGVAVVLGFGVLTGTWIFDAIVASRPAPPVAASTQAAEMAPAARPAAVVPSELPVSAIAASGSSPADPLPKTSAPPTPLNDQPSAARGVALPAASSVAPREATPTRPLPTAGTIPASSVDTAVRPVPTPTDAPEPRVTRSVEANDVAAAATPPPPPAASASTGANPPVAATPPAASAAAPPAASLATPPAAPVVTPVVASVVTPTAAIQRTLAQYQAAFSRLNVGAVREVWPSVDDKALAKAFDRIREESLMFDSCAISVSGKSAVASCGGTTQYVPKVGSKTAKVERQQWRISLRQSGDAWVVDAVNVTAGS